jgi:oxygen-independent coproporphyrinogen-3 oxidase
MMDVAEKYLDYLEREIDLLAERIPSRREVAQFHWGGGTPTFYEPAQLERLFRAFGRHFTLLKDAEVAVEVDPHTTTHEHLELLSQLGFNRLSLGVQDFTSEVQEVIDRNQTFEETESLIEKAREVGFTEGINIDLIYGLPLQKVETFDSNLDQVLRLRPERVAVYSFAYVPWLKGHQKKLDESTLPSPDIKLDLYLTAMNRFLEACYDPIGMDHFALPDDELAVAARNRTLYRNFMGYTVKPATDMLAFGISGIGDIQGAFVQNEKKLSSYYDAIDRNELPVHRGYVLDEDDLLRRHVITQLMCNFGILKEDVSERFQIDFDSYFKDSLELLAEPLEAGFIEIDDEGITVNDSGRLFVRNVCMAFDRYLGTKPPEKRVFSRTV